MARRPAARGCGARANGAAVLPLLPGGPTATRVLPICYPSATRLLPVCCICDPTVIRTAVSTPSSCAVPSNLPNFI